MFPAFLSFTIKADEKYISINDAVYQRNDTVIVIQPREMTISNPTDFRYSYVKTLILESCPDEFSGKEDLNYFESCVYYEDITDANIDKLLEIQGSAVNLGVVLTRMISLHQDECRIYTLSSDGQYLADNIINM